MGDGNPSGESGDASRTMEVAISEGRAIRQRQTECKMADARDRGRESQAGRNTSMSRPPTSISSVHFDQVDRPNTGRSMKTSSTVSMSGSEYRATLDRMSRLEENLEGERRARLAAERELAKLKNNK